MARTANVSRSQYWTWNDVLANHFFNSSNIGRQVFLFVTPDLIAELGSRIGLGAETFKSSVAGNDPAQIAIRALNLCGEGRWRNTRQEVPQYIAYLSFFVLAAGTDEEDFAPHNYHSRLRRMLDLPGRGAVAGFNRLGSEVWHDLEVWSTQDMDGRLGTFILRRYGDQEHIGIPRAQTLLAQEELDDLPRMFALAGLDPTAEPSEQALVRALDGGTSNLRLRTRRVLEKPRTDVLKAALVEVVRDELDGWDGTIPDADGATGTVYGSLRLCLSINEGAQSGVSSLRCSLRQDYPDSSLTLQSSTGDEFTCEELSAPWSTRLRTESGPWSPADLNWNQSLDLTEADFRWRLHMRGSPVRIFESGETEQLPDWIEVFRLDREKVLLLAYSPQVAATIEAWGRHACEIFQGIQVSGALPSEWRIARLQGIRDDSTIRFLSLSLAFSGQVALRLVGGLKTGHGKRYFAFAPPVAYVEGGDGTESVVAAGLDAIPTSAGVFPLPAGLPIGDRFDIELIVNGIAMARQSIVLMGDAEWTSPATFFRVDRFGNAAAPGDPGFSGALCDPELVELSSGYSPPLALPVAGKAVLIGRIPGQVADWPADELPQTWTPVWAIGPSGRRKHKTLTFCGPGLDESAPLRLAKGGTYSNRAVKRWRAEVWVNRHRIEPPSSGRLAALWKEFQSVAKRR